MIKNLLPIFLLAFGYCNSMAQVDTVIVRETTITDTVTIPAQVIDTTVARDTAWKVGANIALQFNQASYSNWQAGGVNSITGNTLVTMHANYDNNTLWFWTNLFTLSYGLNYQDNEFNKTDDRIELESRVDRKLSKNWSVSGILNFRTQLTNGYAEPGPKDDSLLISAFMAPGYLVAGLGYTYKPNQRFSAFISPLTSKMTFVQNEILSAEGAFGVEPGDEFRQEVGGYVNMNYRRKLVTNVDMQARLDLYSNYLEGNYEYIDVNSELLLFMKVNDYLTANLALSLIYDHDILFDTDEDGEPEGPRTQFKEVIGVGFVYFLGDKRAAK